MPRLRRKALRQSTAARGRRLGDRRIDRGLQIVIGDTSW